MDKAKLSPEDKGIIERYIARCNWTFAKNYKDKAPHEYIVRNKCSLIDREFVDFIKKIREFGIDREFRIFTTVKVYRYLYIGDKKYWTMGAPIGETIIINRADIDDEDKIMLTFENVD